MTIAGERSRPRVEGQVYQQMEIEYGAFSGRSSSSRTSAERRPHASYERGLLTVTLPMRRASAAPDPVAVIVVRSG